MEDTINTYIICTEDCPLRYLEALAMNGFAKKAEIENCDKNGKFQKIKLYLTNDKVVTSKCRFSEEVKQSLRIINVYIGFARQNKAWEKLAILDKKGID